MPNLEHDPELVQRLASMYEANAELHFRRVARQGDQRPANRFGWTQHEMLGASSLVIAASYWSLIEPRKARYLYRRAGEIYQYLGHGYGIVLALASASFDDLGKILSTVDETAAPPPQTIGFAMVANEFSESNASGKRIEKLNAEWRHAGNVPIGRLGIPLDHYGACAQAMHAVRHDQRIDYFMKAAAGYVNRAAEVLRTASHDRFHWSRLRSSILPAEPEAIAMTTAMSMMSYALFKMPISELPDLDDHGRLLVNVGDDMRNAAAASNDEDARHGDRH